MSSIPLNALGDVTSVMIDLVADRSRDLLSQQVTQLERAKAHFLALAIRELNPSLQLVQRCSTLLDQMLQQGVLDAVEIQRLADTIAASTERLHVGIEEVLDATAIQAQSLELNIKPMKLEQAVQLARRDLLPLMQETGCEIQVAPLDTLPPLEGDLSRLRQALRYLLEDMLRHTPAGERITVMAVATIKEGEPWLHIAISAPGAGVSAAACADFFLMPPLDGENGASPTATTRGQTLRLGIARGLIEAHGGAIRAESTGKGKARMPTLRFHISLPTRPSQRHRFPGAGSPTAGTPPQR